MRQYSLHAWMGVLVSAPIAITIFACGADPESSHSAIAEQTIQAGAGNAMAPGRGDAMAPDAAAGNNATSPNGAGSNTPMAGDGGVSATAIAPTVNTPPGDFPAQSYRGTTRGGVTSFLGIRYAAAPVGNLRFAPPQTPPALPGTIAATDPGSACPQVASPFGTASTQEDCLFLNVHAPASAQTGRKAPRQAAKQASPVMVFFHGGDFVFGAGSLYDPTDLALKGDTIVVTINYRLGILGYMAHPALTQTSAAGSSGNYGLEDQQFALQWIQQNISAFGGDANNVTIFGESAGGFSVCANIVSPAANGLFARAITESGPCSFPLPTLSSEEALGTQIAASLGCTGSTADATAHCLRQATVDQILAAQGAITSASSLTSISAFFPNVDGVLIPLQPISLITLGQYARVPIIEGTNHDEGTLFIALAFDLNPSVGPLTADAYPAAVASFASSLASQSGSTTSSALQAQQIAAEIVAEYPLSEFASPGAALSAIFTDAGFSCPANMANQLFALQGPVFGYEFNDPNAPMLFLPPVSFPYGASHTDELAYLFTLANHPAPLDADQKALARTMEAYWTNFAARGDPNGLNVLPYWPTTSVLTGAVQSLMPPTPATSTDFSAEHRCTFWSGILLQTTLAGVAGQLAGLGVSP